MNHPQRRLIDNPEYMYGQVLALRALLLGLADLTLQRNEFRARSLDGLERLRTAMLPSEATDSALTAVDDTEAWLRTATAPQ